MRLFGIAVVLFATWSCHSSVAVRSEHDGCGNNDCLTTPTLPGYQAESSPYPLKLHKKAVDLQSDVIESWKQIALEASMSDAMWVRFGGERLIERPYAVDFDNIRVMAVDEGCQITGKRLLMSLGAICNHVKLVLPTDQQSACASFSIEIVIIRQSGKVVDMRDSFWTLSQTRTSNTNVNRPKGDCGIHLYDKPAHGGPRPFN